MLSRAVLLSLVLGCADPASEYREARVIDTLAEDNYISARREPELVAMKLKKMQRGPYEWMRGTAALYWRDLMEPGGDRLATEFGDPRSSRVLLVGDAHLENVGTFRAADGTMFVDWNDFDATGFGPFTADVRRLAASFAIVSELGAPGDTQLASDLAREIAIHYTDAIATLAGGARIAHIGYGAHPLFDDELEKAEKRGKAHQQLEELAPVFDGTRQLAGDLDEIEPADGVIEDEVRDVDEEQARWIDRAIDNWRTIEPAAGAVKLRCRRIGSGVASYAVYRFQAVLEGPTAALDDDMLIELKETRDGIVVRGVPILQGAEWPNPAVRAVDTQRRLHARRDGDMHLGASQVGGLSLKIRDREAFQRGMDAEDIAELAADDPDELRALARLYGRLLGRAHGAALTEERVPGYTVIVPVLAGRIDAFADEIAMVALADAQQVFSDHAALRDTDLGAAVIPRSR